MFGKMITHTVRPGESLASIAKAYYGTDDDNVVGYLFRHNSMHVYDVNRVYPGQNIVIPYLQGMKSC